MHVKNIRNMKFNGQIFKIHQKKKRYIKSLKSFSLNQFGEKLCSFWVVWLRWKIGDIVVELRYFFPQSHQNYISPIWGDFRRENEKRCRLENTKSAPPSIVYLCAQLNYVVLSLSLLILLLPNELMAFFFFIFFESMVVLFFSTFSILSFFLLNKTN